MAFKDKLTSICKDFNNTEDSTSKFDANDIENNKVMSILAYIGILVLIPIFAAKDSDFARFHANQGLLLLICGIVLGLIALIPIVKYIAIIFDIVLLAMMIIGIINVCNGKAKDLPIIGAIRILK